MAPRAQTDIFYVACDYENSFDFFPDVWGETRVWVWHIYQTFYWFFFFFFSLSALSKHIRCSFKRPRRASVLSRMSSLANSSQVDIWPFDPPVAISAPPRRDCRFSTGCKTLTCVYVTTKLLILAINTWNRLARSSLTLWFKFQSFTTCFTCSQFV